LIDRVRKEMEVLGPIDTARAEARRIKLKVESLPPIKMIKPEFPIIPRVKAKIRRVERKFRR